MPSLLPYMEAPHVNKIEACNLVRSLRDEDTISAHKRLASMASFILIEEDSTIATGSFDFTDDNEVYLDNIVVAWEKRRKRHGKFIVQNIESIALQAAGQDIIINVDSTTEGESFYWTLGFRPNGGKLGTFTKTIRAMDVTND